MAVGKSGNFIIQIQNSSPYHQNPKQRQGEAGGRGRIHLEMKMEKGAFSNAPFIFPNKWQQGSQGTKGHLSRCVRLASDGQGAVALRCTERRDAHRVAVQEATLHPPAPGANLPPADGGAESPACPVRRVQEAQGARHCSCCHHGLGCPSISQRAGAFFSTPAEAPPAPRCCEGQDTILPWSPAEEPALPALARPSDTDFPPLASRTVREHSREVLKPLSLWRCAAAAGGN